MSVVFSTFPYSTFFEIKIKMCKINITFPILQIFSVTGVASAPDFGEVKALN